MTPKAIRPYSGEDPIHLLWRCQGYYRQVPKPDGTYEGPLVGYAHTYKPEDLQMVGRIYCNFAKIESHGPAIRWVAEQLAHKLEDHLGESLNRVTTLCGVPTGGQLLGGLLAAELGKRYVFPEKKEVAAATEKGRARSKFVWGRHEPEPGDVVLFVEDVSNNFSSPGDLAPLIEAKGAAVAGLTCFLNRSETVESAFKVRDDLTIPVVPLVRKAMEQFRQDDPRAAGQIPGNVVWKAKDEWSRLLPFIGTFVAP
jgi:orotate phosphoribosyltransferase